MARCFRLKKKYPPRRFPNNNYVSLSPFPVSRFPQARVQQGAQGELPADTHLQLQEGEECICGFIFFFFSWQLCLVCTHFRSLLFFPIFPFANGQAIQRFVLPETRMSIFKKPSYRFPGSSVSRFPGRPAVRSRARSAATFPESSARPSPGRSAATFPGSSADRCPSRTVPRCLGRSARPSPGSSARPFLGSSAARSLSRTADR